MHGMMTMQLKFDDSPKNNTRNGMEHKQSPANKNDWSCDHQKEVNVKQEGNMSKEDTPKKLFKVGIKK